MRLLAFVLTLIVSTVVGAETVLIDTTLTNSVESTTCLSMKHEAVMPAKINGKRSNVDITTVHQLTKLEHRKFRIDMKDGRSFLSTYEAERWLSSGRGGCLYSDPITGDLIKDWVIGDVATFGDASGTWMTDGKKVYPPDYRFSPYTGKPLHIGDNL